MWSAVPDAVATSTPRLVALSEVVVIGGRYPIIMKRRQAVTNRR